jgi:FkbM family methyltransferase
MHHRSKKGIFSAFFKKQFYIAFVNIFRYFSRPLEVSLEYIFRFGSYPREISVKTPIGKQKATLYSSDDMITLVECFGKLDYRAGKDISCVVDFGSNIGISALYFLTRNNQVKVYLYEPLPKNIERLKRNLQGFENRYELDSVAVGLENETSLFGCETTGRYGGLNKGDMESQIEVQVKNANEVVQDILNKNETIDILKIDIEGLEEAVVNNLEPHLLKKIDRVYAETETEFKGDLPGFKKEQYGAIARFFKKKI